MSINNINNQDIVGSDDEDDIIARPVGSINKYKSNKSYSSPKEIQKAINIVVLTVFLGSMSFTILMPSMYDYLISINPELGKYNGRIVAAYSLGQFLSSPIFGWWGNRRTIVEPLMISITISMFGNLFYGVLYKFGHAAAGLMFFARFVVGVGAGNVSVCRAFASESSDISNKTTTMAKMGAAQGVGFVLGPAIGYVLTYVNFHLGGFHFDEYTAPAYLSVLFSIINLVIIGFFLRDHSQKVGAESNETKSLINNINEEDSYDPLVNRDNNETNTSSSFNPIEVVKNWVKSHQKGQKLTPIFISIYLFMVVITIFSVFESILTVMTQHYYGWLVKQNGYILGGTGILSIFVFIVISLPVIKKFDDRKTTLFGFVNLFIALLLITNWGAPFKFEKSLPLLQFIIGSVFVSIGYPIASSLVYAIYSKVLNPKSQGTKMGWLTAGGSLARMLGPVWAQAIWTASGDEGTWLFLTTAFVCLTGIFVLSVFYRKLDPHPDYKIPPKVVPNQESKDLS